MIRRQKYHKGAKNPYVPPNASFNDHLGFRVEPFSDVTCLKVLPELKLK